MRSGVLPALILVPLCGVLLASRLPAAQEGPMVITVLQAEVRPDRTGDLERAYRERTGELPDDIVETFLVRDGSDASQFRIVTVWRSSAALEAMRASGVTPTGVLIFQAAGAEPTLSVHDVLVHRTGGAGR